MDPVILIAGSVGISVILVFWALASAVSGKKQRAFSMRMSRVQGKKVARAPKEAAEQSLRLHSHSRVPLIDKLMKRYLPHPALLLQRLERAGLNFSVGEYLLLSVCVAAVFAIIGFFVFRGNFLAIVGLVAVAAGIMVPHLFVSLLTSRRLKAFTAEFPEAIDLIVRGLKSGLPVPASIRIVAEEIRPPLGSEFALISDRLRIGQNMDEALKLSAERVPTPEFRFFVISLGVQRETGGNLAETLENLSDVLRKRRQMRQKIKAMSSEAKASAIILGSLPFLMLGIMMLLNPGYVTTLFTDTRGLIMVAFAVACLLTGIFVMAKMVRFEI